MAASPARRLCLIGLGFLSLHSALSAPISAAAVAFDHAQDSLYAAATGGAWTGLNPTSGENPVNPPTPDNGGTGFQTWNFVGGYQDPTFSPYGHLNHFIDGADFPASTYNQLGAPAFALTNANRPYFGDTARATRGFNSPLAVGDTLSVKFDNPTLAPLEFAAAGFLIRLNTGDGPVISGAQNPTVKERFDVLTTAARNTGGDLVGTNWLISDLAGTNDSGLSSDTTTSGAQFSFTLTGPETYTMSFKRLSDGATLLSHTGSLENADTGAIDCIEITLFGNGSGNGMLGGAGSPTGQREFFFNDLQISHSLSGDYNSDGIVDAADYTVWRDTVGKSVAAGTGADGNGDGTVNASDYDVWKMQFGATSGAGATEVASVPEPSSATLLSITVYLVMSFLGDGRQGVLQWRCDLLACSRSSCG